MTANSETETTVVVDDKELLAILGLCSPPSSPYLCNSIAVLDWDDMPELSEAEDEDDNQSVQTKRKYHDDEVDIFAEYDFIEVSIEPEQKKQKTLLIQQPFISETQIEEDIRLALDLISSTD